MKNKIYVLMVGLFFISACDVKNDLSNKEVKIAKVDKVFIKKTSTIKKDTTTEVLIDKEIKKEDIKSYYQHGDHWHIITKDGKEHITYINPETIKENVVLETVKVVEQIPANDLVIVEIKKHGDHWHLYSNDGKEFLTYKDPSSLYPHISIGEYIGSHNNENKMQDDKQSSLANNQNIPSLNNTTSLTIIPILNKEMVDINDIVRILKHGDHYHLYDSKGNEALTYENPLPYYPNASFGDYVGSHNDDNAVENEIVWPIGITKIISHQDHWHLYVEDKEVAVVHINPKKQYPDAEWIEEEADEDISIADEELFEYEDIEPKMIESLLPYLSNNLKAMTSFGSIVSNIPVYGSNGQKDKVFYWLHNDHYHAISIKQLIQKAKLGEFKDHSAQDVVAVLKYKILNPDVNLELAITVEYDEVKIFLMNHYGIVDKRDIMRIYSNVEVYQNGETISIHLSNFEKVDGHIRAKISLPVFKASDINDDVDNTLDNTNIDNNDETFDKVIDKEKNDDNKAIIEAKILNQIADYLGIDKDEAFDVIYEIIDDVNFKVADLIVNDDGTVSLNDKKYPLVLP